MLFSLFSTMDISPANHDTVADVYRLTEEQAVVADRTGFHSFWIAENHQTTLNGVCPAPAVFLAHLLARTRRIHLGPAVAVLPVRHPLTTAEDYAVLAVLGGDRFEMGVGNGFIDDCLSNFGRRKADRKLLFDEALVIVRKAWDGESFDYGGECHRLSGARLNTAPDRHAQPPIWGAAVSEASLLRFAAQDMGVHFGPFIGGHSLEAVYELVATAAATYRRNGSRRDARSVSVMLHCHVGRESAEAIRVGSEALERRLDALVRGGIMKGGMHHAAARMRKARRDRVVLFGDPETVADRIVEMRENGLAHLLLYMDYGDIPMDDVLESMRLFASEVVPRVEAARGAAPGKVQGVEA